MKRKFVLLAAMYLYGCASQPTHRNDDVNETLTTFAVENLCDTPVDFVITMVSRQHKPALNFGVTKGKLLGFIISTDLSEKSVARDFSVPANGRVTVKQDTQTYTQNTKLSWFRKFRISPLDGVVMNDPYDNAQWYRANRNGQIVYTFFVCQP